MAVKKKRKNPVDGTDYTDAHVRLIALPIGSLLPSNLPGGGMHASAVFSTWASKVAFNSGRQPIPQSGAEGERTQFIVSISEQTVYKRVTFKVDANGNAVPGPIVPGDPTKDFYVDSVGNALPENGDPTLRVVLVPSITEMFGKKLSDLFTAAEINSGATVFDAAKRTVYRGLQNIPELVGGVED